MNRFRLIFSIAVRFIQPRSHGNLLSFVSFVSIIGVSIGVLAMLLVTSVINGFEQELENVVSGTQGQVMVFTRGSPIRNEDEIQKKILEAAPEIQHLTATLVSEVMLTGPKGSVGAALEGVEIESFSRVTRVLSMLREGVFPQASDELVLGSALADRLGVRVGDWVRVVLPFVSGAEQAGYGTPQVQDFKLSGIVHLGMHEYDTKYGYLDRQSLQNFVFGENRPWISAFRAKLKNDADPIQVAARLSEQFSFPYRVRDWSQLNRNLLHAIKLEKAVIAVLLTAILIVAAFNVISALLMMVHGKEKEISILRVIGANQRDQFFLFSLIGSFFGVAGVFSGLVLALIFVWVLGYTQLISLPPEVYHLEFLPVVIRYGEWGLITGLAFVICFLATLGPAARIAARSPVEGLKWSQ